MVIHWVLGFTIYLGTYEYSPHGSYKAKKLFHLWIHSLPFDLSISLICPHCSRAESPHGIESLCKRASRGIDFNVQNH